MHVFIAIELCRTLTSISWSSRKKGRYYKTKNFRFTFYCQEFGEPEHQVGKRHKRQYICKVCPLTWHLISAICFAYNIISFLCGVEYGISHRQNKNKKADKINSNNVPRFTNGVTEVNCTIIFLFDWNKCVVLFYMPEHKVKLNARQFFI